MTGAIQRRCRSAKERRGFGGVGLLVMGRLVVAVVAACVLVAGALTLLAWRNSERAQTRVEKVVPLATLQK